MTVGIYIRVSTLEQAKEGYSIPAQKERLKAYCKAQGWNDYKLYIDEGVSAKDLNRPKLKLLLDHVEEGKINIILVYRLDRFTRRVKDLHKMLEFLDEHKCGFKSATEVYDTTTAMGRLFITIVAALAEWETDNLSERIKMALDEKVSKGERVGNVPYGYYLDNEGVTHVNEKEKRLVLDMIEKLKKGFSVARIAKYLNVVNDDRNWTSNAVFRILRNPALHGAIRWNDEVYEDMHEGIITKDEFLKVQKMLNDLGIVRKRDVKSTYLFQSVLVCPSCNHILTVNRYVRKRKDGSKYQSAIYRCQSCARKRIKVENIGEKRFIEALYEYMKNVEIKPIEIKKVDSDKENYSSELKKIERKREKYQRAWASDLISDDEFEKRMNETKEQTQAIEKIIGKKEKNQIDVEAIKNIIFTFNENFRNLTVEEKQEFIASFIRRIHYKVIPRPPIRPDKSVTGKGKGQVIITNVEFY